MNEIGWWVLVFMAIWMFNSFLEGRDAAKGNTSTEFEIGRAIITLLMLLLWGFAAIVRLLFF